MMRRRITGETKRLMGRTCAQNKIKKGSVDVGEISGSSAGVRLTPLAMRNPLCTRMDFWNIPRRTFGA
ncbi:unnamed protein product [Ixodes persulcatus]